MKIKKITKSPLFLAESALWDETRKCWFFVNIFEGELYQYFPSNELMKKFSFGQITSAVVLNDRDKLVLALQDGIGLFDPEKNSLEIKVNPNEEYKKITRFNDCKCDPAGRLYAGTMDLKGRPGYGKLYRIFPDWTYETALDHVDYSNGIVWNVEGTNAYYTDTYQGKVYEFRYDLTTGNFSEKKIICSFPTGEPDGMAIDEEDRLFIALWGGSGIAVVDTKTKKLLEIIHIPVPIVSSIGFGGDNYESCLVTTAQKDLSEDELGKYPDAGSVYLITDFPYHGSPFYRMRT